MDIAGLRADEASRKSSKRAGAALSHRAAGGRPVVHLLDRLARLLRLLPNSIGVACTRRMDQAAVARHRLEAMELRTRSFCRAATPRRRPGYGGPNRWQPTWPMAARQQPRTCRGFANRVLQINRRCFRRNTAIRLIQRTAGYGPVRPVVWEGRSREAARYPD
jgi:hypothetical protein